MKDKIHILCPEYVPFENKGEEAIIRGTIDILFSESGDKCIYHVVDLKSKKYYVKNGIHFHPGDLFFSMWRLREFDFGLSWEQIYSSACSLVRNGLNKFFPWWIVKPHKQARNLKLYLSRKKNIPDKYKKSIEQLKKIDYIIAGHDGGLNEYVCHILNELRTLGLRYGIFGSSMKPNLHNKILLNIYRETFKKSDFNITRNPIGYKWAINKFPEIKFDLKPDPAFGMKPIDDVSVSELIQKLQLISFFSKPVIMVTTAEPAPIARHSFDVYIDPMHKIIAHRYFLAELFRKIHSNFDFNILFIPHTIGPDKKMDDRIIAEDVIKKANLGNDTGVMVLKADLTAKELKGLMSRADFLIAERVHSIIGAIGVNIPFLSLASRQDLRIDGILVKQMNLGENIYYLNQPNVNSAFEKFKSLYEKKVSIHEYLMQLNIKIKEEFEQTNQKIQNSIN
jgi:polysaccharide pyruvyl transferase WcaK-like protein